MEKGEKYMWKYLNINNTKRKILGGIKSESKYGGIFINFHEKLYKSKLKQKKILEYSTEKNQLIICLNYY